MKKIFIFSLAIIFSLAFFGFVQAAWEEPSTDPPGGNISPPLNQGSTDQYKEGGLLIGDNSVDSLEQGYVFAVAGADAYFLQGVQIDGTLNIDGTLTASGGILVQDSNLTIDNGTLNIDDGNIDLAESTISVIDTTNPIVVYVSSSRSDGIAIRAATLSGTSIYASTGDGIGIHASTTGAGIGIYGVAEDASGIAIAGKAEVVNGLAGRFDGEVRFNPLGSARTEDTTIVGGEIVVTDGSSITTIDGALIEVDDGVGSTIIDGGDVIIDGDLTVVTDAYHIGELLEVGGSTLYADANSDRVGIGTDDPDAKLHVYSSGGSGSTDINLEYNFTGTINGSRDSNWVLRANSSGGKFQIMNPTIDRLVIDTSGNVSIPSYNCSILGNSGKLTTDVNGQIICANDIGGDTGPDDDWVIPGDGNIYRATGNVGIGTASPYYMLHIKKDTAGLAGLRVESTYQGAGAAEIAVKADSVTGFIRAYDDGDTTFPLLTDELVWWSSGGGHVFISERDFTFSTSYFEGYETMIIKNSGNVGIGTTAPGEKLEVRDDGDGSISRIRITDTNDNPELQLQYGDDEDIDHWGIYVEKIDDETRHLKFWNSDDRLIIDNDGNVSIPSYNCSIFGNSGKLTTDVNGQIICSADIGGETGPDDDWTIPGDGNIYRATGNVGIGTDDPNYPLHIVYGDSESPGLFIENRVGDDTADASITLLDDRSETYYTFGVDAQIEDGTDRSFIISDSDSLDSPRFMVENTSGYIGIGTVDPGYNLDVSGDINFTGNLYQNEEEYDGGGGGESDGDWTISGSNLYSAKQGNVGIGVMSPSGKLEVFTEDGQLQQSAIKGRATYSGEKGIWGVNNAGYGVVGESDEYVGVQALSVSGTALMANVESGTIADFRLDDETQVIINNQGNVGIGTTNPGYALDVSDSGNAAMIRIENNNADNKYTGLRLDRDSNAEKWFLGMNDSNDNLRFRSSSSNDYMVIDTSGNIHILNYNCSTLGNSGKLTTNSSGQIICSADIGGGETGGDDDWGGVSGDPTLGGDIYHTGNVGIGTTNPDTLLEISGSGSNMLKITNSDITADTYIGHYVNDSSGNPNGMYITFTRNNTRDAWIGPGSGDNRDFYIANEALDKKIYLSTTPTTQGTDITRMTIDSDGNVGIGTTSPAEKFEVYDGADLLFSVIEGAQEGEMSVNIPGKLNVGTIDPIYVIAEERYATYGHSTIGVKEEVLGKININKKIKENLYQYKIDFSKQEQGSDLWLFNEITDFGLEWENLIVMLTPQGRADVWYEIEAEKDLLIIYSDQLITVSYRLVAPRFDSQEHPTYLPDSDYEGLRVR